MHFDEHFTSTRIVSMMRTMPIETVHRCKRILSLEIHHWNGHNVEMRRRFRRARRARLRHLFVVLNPRRREMRTSHVHALWFKPDIPGVSSKLKLARKSRSAVRTQIFNLTLRVKFYAALCRRNRHQSTPLIAYVIPCWQPRGFGIGRTVLNHGRSTAAATRREFMTPR